MTSSTITLPVQKPSSAKPAGLRPNKPKKPTVNTEKQYYYDLAHARAQQREVSEVKAEAGRVIKPPPIALYLFLYGLAAFGDIIDFAELTGIGEILTILVDIFVGVILFLTSRSARNRMQDMNQFQDGIYNRIQEIEKKIQTYRNTYAKILRASRKIKILRKPVRKIALRLGKLRRSVTRNPVTRNIAAIIADFIPIIQYVPWRTVGVYLMKRNEMRAFQEAQSMLPEYMGAKADEIQTANDLAEAEAAEAGVEQAT